MDSAHAALVVQAKTQKNHSKACTSKSEPHCRKADGATQYFTNDSLHSAVTQHLGNKSINIQ